MGLLDAAVGAVTGTGNNSPEKMNILIEGTGNDLHNAFAGVKGLALTFNPTSIAHNLKANWTAVPSHQSHTNFLNFDMWPLDLLTVELMFDTTETEGKSPGSRLDVRVQSSVIANLTRAKPDKHRPPLCQLTWGNTDSEGKSWFVGVATIINQTFSYFHRDGTPLRAKLNCTFTQWIASRPTADREMQSADIYKSHLVKRGDTLSSIAKTQLHDAGLWRAIAQANGITDPLHLEAGRILHIPIISRK